MYKNRVRIKMKLKRNRDIEQNHNVVVFFFATLRLLAWISYVVFSDLDFWRKKKHTRFTYLSVRYYAARNNNLLLSCILITIIVFDIKYE
jgi:hypothetical protein